MKTHLMLITPVALAALLLVGCELFGLGGSSDTTDRCSASGAYIPREAYCYTAYDEDGTAVVQGRLVLVLTESTENGLSYLVSGSWSLKKLAQDRETGPQVGTGELRGTIGTEGQVFIDMNPGYADNNVFLSGTFGAGGFEDLSGSWSFSTLLGHVAGGRFEANKR